MDVSTSADRLPPVRLLVAIETPGEEIKKRQRIGKTYFFMATSQSLTFCTFIGRKCLNNAQIVYMCAKTQQFATAVVAVKKKQS